MRENSMRKTMDLARVSTQTIARPLAAHLAGAKIPVDRWDRELTPADNSF
jgi:hypothetical protein